MPIQFSPFRFLARHLARIRHLAGRRTLARNALTAALSLAAILTVGCESDTSAVSSSVKITYPAEGTLFPPDVAAPVVTWQLDGNESGPWQLSIEFSSDAEPMILQVSSTSWEPEESDWELVKRRSTSSTATITVSDSRGASDSVRFSTSIDPVGDAIFYREVPLPFIEAVQDPSRIRWRFGEVSSTEQPPVVLTDLPVCGNCHSFSGNGDTLGLDVDYGNDKGGYALLSVTEEMVLDDEKIISWSDYKKDDGEATFGLLSQVSPDGRYVISTVKDRAVFVATPGIEFSQLFFPIKGILVVYDRETGEYSPLPGADDPAYVQSNPTWSPDGKHIVFARAPVYDNEAVANASSLLLDEKDVPEFIEDKEPFKYDLYRVPFNDGAGGTAEPIEGASHNGRSNFFAKYSPDGKWIVFTQAENYMLLMPDSELFIVPAEGGEAKRLAANTARMNSWHSFSSNGRWLVFSSKINTPYTQLFLTHIDDEGNSTPPVVLDKFTNEDRAANIPEFVPISGDAIASIEERFLDAYSFLRAGMANERTGNYAAAIASYDRGLELNPNDIELLNAKGFALFQNGDSEQAARVLEMAVREDPEHWKSHNNLALTYVDLGELAIAEAHFRESLSIEPQPAIYNDLGFVLERQGLGREAMEQYRQAVEIAPDSATARFNLASALARRKSNAEAEQHFAASVATEPSGAGYVGLGIVQWEQGKRSEAMQSMEQALELDPDNQQAFDQLGAMLVEVGRREEGRAMLTKAKEISEQQTSLK